MNPLLDLQKEGQSIWLDFITRGLISQGGLQKLIREDGLRGVTSNPTIFQKAMTAGNDYDPAMQPLIRQELATPAIFESLAIDDIQKACDLFKPVFESTKGDDGYVSLEVNPNLARDTQATLAEARRLFRAVNRPNVMIKIPGTQEGLGAIEQALGDGININVTLIFSLERYQKVMDAWLGGLEKLAASGKPLNTVASVASFFVSRVDVLIDGQLEKKASAATGPEKQKYEKLMGKTAIANAKLAYRMFQQTVTGARFKALAAKGARVQRPLWASTSTKNPKYRDVVYVEELVGRDTVNTLPPATVDAFRDHGKVRQSITENLPQAEETIKELKLAGIDLAAATRQLEEDGLRLFAESYDGLIQSLDKKRESLKIKS